MSTKLAPAERKQQILTAALLVAVEAGYQHITRETVAAAANVSPALVSMHFSTMDALRDEVVAEAVRVQRLAVIGQALTARDPVAIQAPSGLKKKALAYFHA